MEHDPEFAARVLAAEPDALRSARLGPNELALLRSVDPAAYSADRGDKRIEQFLRNVSSEFRACLAVGPGGDGSQGWVAGFARSDEFHVCVAESGCLPYAFRDYALRLSKESVSAAFGVLARLEGVMAEARREIVRRPAPAPGEVALSPTARVLETPSGTHALAAALQRGGSAPAHSLGSAQPEWILVTASAAPPPGGLRELRVEVLASRVAEFLREAERPQPRSAWRSFACHAGLSADEVEAVAEDVLAGGVLRAGAPAAAAD